MVCLVPMVRAPPKCRHSGHCGMFESTYAWYMATAKSVELKLYLLIAEYLHFIKLGHLLWLILERSQRRRRYDPVRGLLAILKAETLNTRLTLYLPYN